MVRILTLLVLLAGFSTVVHAQELNATVTIQAQKISDVDRTVFDQMQRDIYNFLNTRKWSNDVFATQERIEISFLINLTNKISADEFGGTMQVQTRRPIYNTSYNSVLLNHVDQDFQIRYSPSIPLDFSETTFLSNLTAMLGYYAYLALGMDYDSYGMNGGNPFYEKARTIVNNAQSATEVGWKSFEDNRRNRYWLVNNMLDPQYKPFRECLYKYHRLGLDVMESKPEQGRVAISAALEGLRKLYLRKPQNANMQIWFLAKVDEIINIFSEATPDERNRMYALLNQIDPGNAGKYQKLKKSK